MDGHMFCTSTDVKIFGSVVALDTVDVVNDLTAFQFATENLFSNQNMFRGICERASAVRRADHYIAPLIGEPTCRSRGTSVSLSDTLKPPIVTMPAECLMSDTKRTRDLAQRFARLQTGLKLILRDVYFVCHTYIIPQDLPL